jgi:phosphoribosylglycinamide formyltransferase 2
LGLPLEYTTYGSGACGAYKAKNENHNPTLNIPDSAFTKNSFVRVFGKPESHVGRRMAVSLVLDEVEKAKERALEITDSISDS